MFAAKDLFATRGGYRIAKSLRFRSGATTYLNRTFGTPTDNKKFSVSAWVKRGLLTTAAGQVIFGSGVASGTATVGSLFFLSSGTGADAIGWYDQTSVSTVAGYYYTNAVFRDPSAWYHIVCAIDTANATSSNRCRIWVNGVLQTLTTSTAYASGASTGVNVANNIGGVGSVINVTQQQYFDGYMAEVNFIDGQALDPASFGQTDTNGVWQPKAYTGTYGTNGFYLKFTDVGATSSSNVGYGKDFAGTNRWTTNNFGTTSTATTYDSMLDSPTNYDDGGNGVGNYAVLNPVNVSGGGSTITDGNLACSAASTTTYGKVLGSFGISSGKWYWEATVTAVGTTANIGLGDGTLPTASGALGYYAGELGYLSNGNKYTNNTSSAYGASYTTNDVIGVAYDAGAGSITFYKNNVSQGAITGLSGVKYPAFSNGGGTSTYAVNFGQRPFAYAPPSDFKPLNTQNLTAPTIANGAQYMNATLYTGSASTQSVTNSGSMQPDLVWIKDRTSAQDNKLTDAVRGTTKGLISNTTGDETTDSNGVTAFNANGFSLGTGTRAYSDSNADGYVAWQWKESVTSGFDIVTYTGNGSARTISHSLNAVPNMIIVKARTTASTDQGWPVYHSANTSAPETDYLMLNTTAATADLDTVWNDTAPTSSVFSVGTNANVNANNDTYVAYLWCAIAGYSAFGSYTGNASTDGPFVYLGFRPRYVMYKMSSNVSDWWVIDTSRSLYNDAGTAYLSPNTSGAEGSVTPWIDILSNGFKIRSSNATLNGSATYIYAAFAENPFKISRAR